MRQTKQLEACDLHLKDSSADSLSTTCKSSNLSCLQVITLDHDKYMHELENIAQCHNKSLQARDKLKLRAVAAAGTAAFDLTARVPKTYEALGEQAGTPLSKSMVTLLIFM